MLDAAIRSGHLGIAWHLRTRPGDLGLLHRLPDDVLLGAVRLLPVLKRTARAEILAAVRAWDAAPEVQPEKERLCQAIEGGVSSLTASVNYARYKYIERMKNETRDIHFSDFPDKDDGGIWTEATYPHGAVESSIESGWTVDPDAVNRQIQARPPPVPHDSGAVAAPAGPGADGGAPAPGAAAVHAVGHPQLPYLGGSIAHHADRIVSLGAAQSAGPIGAHPTAAVPAAGPAAPPAEEAPQGLEGAGGAPGDDRGRGTGGMW